MAEDSQGTGRAQGTRQEQSDHADRLERRAYHFVGFVQSRGFRYACYTCATRAKVTGWVMNNLDGSVSAEAQGTPAELDNFVFRLTRMVSGAGDSWSIGSDEPVETIPGEKVFRVVR